MPSLKTTMTAAIKQRAHELIEALPGDAT